MKTMELSWNGAGGSWEEGYLWKLREQQKEENVFTQGTWVSHWRG
jgi:hypothetical protein